MTGCPNCGHTDQPTPDPAVDREPSEGFLPGESWVARMDRMAREIRDWVRGQEITYVKAGTTAIRLHTRRGPDRIVHVDILHEVDRRGMPDPERIWHRFPDGTMTPRFAEDTPPATPGPNVEYLGRLPSAMQVRNEAAGPDEREARREKVEPISRDPGDFTSKNVFARMR